MPLGFDEITSDMHECIKDTFGETETVTYKPTTGPEKVIVGVFNTRHTVVDPDTEQVLSSNQPTLGVKLSDLDAAPVKGDLVNIRSQDYRVHDSQEDGEGWSELFLYEVSS